MGKIPQGEDSFATFWKSDSLLALPKKKTAHRNGYRVNFCQCGLPFIY